jgi:hypothetical protein
MEKFPTCVMVESLKKLFKRIPRVLKWKWKKRYGWNSLNLRTFGRCASTRKYPDIFLVMNDCNIFT